MREALETKLREYSSCIFENREFRAWLKDSDLWLSVYSVLRVRGIEMDKRDLLDILDGKLMDNMPLNLYGFIHRFKDLYTDMQFCAGMQESLDEKLFSRFCSILLGSGEYRKDNPIIYKWSYIAPHFTEIDKNLQELFRMCQRIANPVTKAISVHHGICSIYPCGEESPALALACMYYILMQYKIPLPCITVDDREYNRLMSDYFYKGVRDIDEMFERALLNRIDSVMVFGKESMEYR